MIAQENISGCAVACVAQVIGSSYRRALQYFDKPEKARFDGFYCREIVSALAKAGIRAEFKYLKPKLLRHIYKRGTIVFIACTSQYPVGHYLLKLEGGWMDPWINFPDIRSGAKAGLRKRLPAKAIYAIFPVE